MGKTQVLPWGTAVRTGDKSQVPKHRPQGTPFTCWHPKQALGWEPTGLRTPTSQALTLMLRET